MQEEVIKWAALFPNALVRQRGFTGWSYREAKDWTFRDSLDLYETQTARGWMPLLSAITHRSDNEIYIWSALRRNKDNNNETTICIRGLNRQRVINDAKGNKGVWRLYRSVNLRSMTKAKLELQHQLLEWPDNKDIGKEWLSILEKPLCKAERKFLIDIDDVSAVDAVEALLPVGILERVPTPNGMHFVTPPFHSENIDWPLGVEIKKDALLFQGMI